MQTLRAMPILEVRDVARSAAFYGTLGFADHGAWGEPPQFTIVQRGAITLGLARRDIPAKHEWWAAYLYVSDAEALRSEFTEAGITCTEMHRPEHYGCIDFDVIDPDGHRLAFGQALAPLPGPGLGTDMGRG